MWPSGRRHAWVLGTLALVILTADPMPVHAIGFHFSPANISIQGRPGQVVNRTFSLTLAKDSPPTYFHARTEDWWRSADNSQTFYASPGTIRRSCAGWCTLNPVETSVKPSETTTIKITVRVPDDVRPGGYWAALTVDEVPDPLAPKPFGVVMTFKASISVGIFVEIPPVTRAARITSIRITGDHAAVTLRNEGDVPLKVSGTFEFYRPGEQQPAASVQTGTDPLLPEPVNTCEFSTALPDRSTLPSGRYRVRVIVDVGLDYLMGAEKELDIARADKS